MTAQIAERLRYKGQDFAMRTTPLSRYFVMAGANPSFESYCTALWRGYVGSWEIVDARLYLVGLSGKLKGGTDASLTTFFPDFPDCVFAHWYSGTIRILQGKQLEYMHRSYDNTYERDLFLDIERGVVVSARLQNNGTAQSNTAVNSEKHEP